MPQPLLTRLLSAREQSSFVVIEDTLAQTSVQLTRAFIESSPDLNLLILCCVEHPPQVSVRRLLSDGVRPKTLVFDAHSPMFSLPNTPAFPPPTIPGVKSVLATPIIDLPVRIKEAFPSATNTLIILDSISSLTSISNFPALIRSLTELTSDTTRLLLSYHADILNPTPTPITRDAFLSHLCTTYITVRHVRSSSDDKVSIDANGLGSGVADVMHKKKSGKVVKESVLYEVGEAGRLRVKLLEEGKEVIGKVVAADEAVTKPPPNKDPTANLSFNLSLTDSQKAARSEIELPYMSAQNDSLEVKPNPEQIIHYDLEEDEYDSEDPDADLDI